MKRYILILSIFSIMMTSCDDIFDRDIVAIPISGSWLRVDEQSMCKYIIEFDGGYLTEYISTDAKLYAEQTLWHASISDFKRGYSSPFSVNNGYLSSKLYNGQLSIENSCLMIDGERWIRLGDFSDKYYREIELVNGSTVNLGIIKQTCEVPILINKSNNNTIASARTFNDWITDISCDNEKLRFNVAASETQREGEITISYLGAQDVQLCVKQSANSTITVEKKSVNLDYYANTVSIKYSIENPSNGAKLTASSYENWISNIKVSPSVITFDVEDNNDKKQGERTATLTLSYPDAESIDVTIIQDYVYPKIVTDAPQTFLVDYTGGEYSFSYTIKNSRAEGSISLKKGQDWITDLKCDDQTVSFKVLENPGYARNGWIVMSYVTGSTAHSTFEYHIEQTFNEESLTIYYTSSDGDIIKPKVESFGEDVNLVSNTYVDGIGKLIFDNKPTAIGDSAFYYCSSLTSVTIPDSVMKIGKYAFYSCSSLTSITIPDSVTTIEDSAFYDCESLTNVYYKGDLSAWCKIDFAGYMATPFFYGAKLYINNTEVTELTIPSDISEIKQYTFYGCSSLTSVTIPDSVMKIGKYAFYSCSSLTSITIPDSVTTIGDSAFENCRSLTSVTIGSGVTTIGDYAFYDCSRLTSVTIPDSVRTIGDYAFYNCSCLTSVTIPDSVRTIGDYAFYYCVSLTNVYYKGDLSAWCKIDFADSPANPFYYGAKLYINNTEVTELTIPSDISKIKQYAFYGCSSLTNITIPNSVKTIGDYAFYDCSSLTSVTIGDRVTTIGVCAFSSCSSLTSVTIGDSVTTIGVCAFYGCSSLTSVTIPDSVWTIGDNAFEGCSSLTSVYCKATTPPAGGYEMFSYYSNDYYYPIGCKIYVPTESVVAYKSARYWSEYKNYIVGYDF